MMRINLLPTARRDAVVRLARTRKWIVGISIGTAIAAASLAGGRATWPDDRNQLRNQELTLESAQADLLQLVSSLKEEVDHKLDALHAANEIGDEPDWSILLALIADRTGKKVVLTLVAIEPTASPATPSTKATNAQTQQQPPSISLVLSGIGTSAHQVSLYSVRLEELGLFERVVIEQSSRSPTGQLGSIMFTIRCRLLGEEH